MKICAIILAAGKSARMDIQRNKVFLKFDGRSAIIRSVRAHCATGLFDSIVVACRPEEKDIIEQKLQKYVSHPDCRVVAGGSERQYSVKNAIAVLPQDARIISVHDGARCFVRPETIRDCVMSALRHGSGVAAVKAVDTIKTVSGKRVVATLNRDELVMVQTPQAFGADTLKRAYEKAEADGFLGTDDSSLVERLGEEVYIVNGSRDNIKLTTKDDIKMGKDMVRNNIASNLRVGSGTDVHVFAKERKLILGGVEIPSEYGLLGHSDADVLLHAIMDALAGAARLGDIGDLFPPTDDKYKDISSLVLLKKVAEFLNKCGYSIINIDATLIMQQPKISKYKKAMIKNIADTLGIEEQYISIKATTTEELGFMGRGEGASAHAVCLVQKQW